MPAFYDNLDPEDAAQMEQLARLIFDFRASRDGLLKQYGVVDASALLQRILSGEIAEHPAYEHYLSLNILDDLREALRDELRDFLPGVKPS